MFWIGFIVGMVVLALIGFGVLLFCMKAIDFSWSDYSNMVDANVAAILNRDSRVEVWDEDIEQKVFEAEFKYPYE